MRKRLSTATYVMTAIALAATMLTGCGSGGAHSESSYATEAVASDNFGGVSDGIYSGAYDDSYDDYEVSESAAAEAPEAPVEFKTSDNGAAPGDGTGSGGGTAAEPTEAKPKQNNRKLIYNISYEVETKNLDELDAMIRSRTELLGGYIESSNVDGPTFEEETYREHTTTRWGYYTIRIPADRMKEFTGALEDASNVTSQSSNVQDITLQYTDIDARRKTLEAEQKRLLDWLEKAETIEDMISVEQRLTDVTGDLESLKSQLKTMDNDVSYSTITIEAKERTVFTSTIIEKTFGTRVAESFADGVNDVVEAIQDTIIWLAGNILMILFAIVMILIVIGLVHLIIKLFAMILNGGKKKASKAGTTAAQTGTTAPAAPAGVQIQKPLMEAAPKATIAQPDHKKAQTGAQPQLKTTTAAQQPVKLAEADKPVDTKSAADTSKKA